MQFDHVGLRIESLDRELETNACVSRAEVREVSADVANRLWGTECGALRVWFAHDAMGSIEYFEQISPGSVAIAETHLCVTADSISGVLPWWQSAGFQVLSEEVVEIGSKQTVMLRSKDGVIVQLVADLTVSHEGE